MSEKQHQARRGDNKRHFRKPVRPGGGSSAQPQKQYKRVVSAARTDGGGDTTPPSSPSLNKFDGQDVGLSEEPRNSPLESDTPPETSAGMLVF
ncbi:hypothetical protein Leryth_020972 [Lithospermum erythrorhizon]|nr:hypothetical protein Leryth_020972 [Lithospermum erythrorhizon]